MRTIWKYPVELLDEAQPIHMPTTAKIAYVGRDGLFNSLAIWAEVDNNEAMAVRHFQVFRTGHATTGAYVGTAIVAPFVWHVYELARAATGKGE